MKKREEEEEAVNRVSFFFFFCEKKKLSREKGNEGIYGCIRKKKTRDRESSSTFFRACLNKDNFNNNID